jgi:hypothetical protein
VYVDFNDQLGTIHSSRRFKKDIEAMDKTSESILALKPITFHYKNDKTGTAQFGLIAEEVAEVNPDLVDRDKKGEVYTVRYDAVNAMLLNEFLKEHNAFIKEQRKMEKQERKIQQQEATIAELKKEVEVLVAHTKQQDLRIETVTATVESVRGAQGVSAL